MYFLSYIRFEFSIPEIRGNNCMSHSNINDLQTFCSASLWNVIPDYQPCLTNQEQEWEKIIPGYIHKEAMMKLTLHTLGKFKCYENIIDKLQKRLTHTTFGSYVYWLVLLLHHILQ